jgi:hypothetical protein
LSVSSIDYDLPVAANVMGFFLFLPNKLWIFRFLGILSLVWNLWNVKSKSALCLFNYYHLVGTSAKYKEAWPKNWSPLTAFLVALSLFAKEIQVSIGSCNVLSQFLGHEYALTINDSENNGPGVIDVKHYKIRALDQGGYYITTKKVFNSIRELIDYYSKESGGLCHRLTVAAPRMTPTRPDLSYDTQK